MFSAVPCLLLFNRTDNLIMIPGRYNIPVHFASLQGGKNL